MAIAAAVAPEAAATWRHLAIIDIGSNSIRLVVYDALTRTPQVLFNEKAVCALAQGLEGSGRLNPEGVPAATASLGRFIALARAMEVGTLDILATAAVREASDGPAFVAEIERRFRARVTVLSGEEEARLAASGVLCGTPDADGLVADLGGGSLELVALDKGRISGTAATMPLGLLRLSEASGDDPINAAALIDRHFARVKWLTREQGRPLYAVGGAWRTLARLAIEQINHPLHVLDNFTLAQPHAGELLGLIARQSRKSLEKIPGVPRKRVPHLPLAALLLKKVMERAQSSRLIFSVYGMREGQFLQRLSPEIRAQDPLLAACEHLARGQGRFPAHDEMAAWTAPLFQGETRAQRRLRLAACLLGDLFWNEHPDYRAEQAFLRVVRLPVMGLDHVDRVSLALTVYARYEGEVEPPAVGAMIGLLSEDEQRRARLMGLLLRLGHAISGGVASILAATKLVVGGDALMLLLPAADPVFAPDLTDRRYDRLARLAGVDRFEMRRV